MLSKSGRTLLASHERELKLTSLPDGSDSLGELGGFKMIETSQNKLSTDEAQKTVRFARVTALGNAIFEDSQMTSRWLERSNSALRGLSPMELLDTEEGAREVESVLRRLEYGIYS